MEIIIALFLIYLAFTNKGISFSSAEEFFKTASEGIFSLIGFVFCLAMVILIFSLIF
tara:strand:- start:95 stop:265 length:171 start_codon:yes stop_codon:yes gene_type:complete